MGVSLGSQVELKSTMSREKKQSPQQITQTGAQAVIIGQSLPLSCNPAPFGDISTEGAPPGTKLREGQRAWPEVQSPQRRMKRPVSVYW